MAEGIDHPDKDEKEGKGYSFPSGHLSSPFLKLGQPAAPAKISVLQRTHPMQGRERSESPCCARPGVTLPQRIASPMW